MIEENELDIFTADDGSTTIKLAAYNRDKDEISVSTLTHSFAQSHINGEFGRNKDVYNFTVKGIDYHFTKTEVSASSTTNASYQYSNECVMAIHLALLKSEQKPNPRKIKLYVTLPLEEYYIDGSTKNEKNIARKIEAIKTPVTIRDGKGVDGGNIIKSFEIAEVEVVPEGICAVMLKLDDNVTEFDQTLVIDVGGSSTDVVEIFGNFETIKHEGYAKIGVAYMIDAIVSASKNGRKINQYIANHILLNINKEDELKKLIRDGDTLNLILDAYKKAKLVLEQDINSRAYNLAPKPDNVCLVGGGASLIKASVKNTFPAANFFEIENPQTEQAIAIMEYALEKENQMVEVA